ncbi:MAG: hypothetical protein GXP48_06155 [Acidobacteria bacterium]|nr:hypothetical protein [Acidobacteriota bacterium]
MNVGKRTLCGVAVLTVTVLSIALGVHDGIPRHGGQLTSPRWSTYLAPLARAPLPPGRDVLLILPRDVSRFDAQRLFFETVWRRPWVRWKPVYAELPSSGPALAVLIHPGGPGKLPAPPPPWREVWHSGWIHVFGKVRP